MTDKNPAQEPDDDFELELEPVDPEIEAHQRRRAIQKTRAAEDSVDIDQLYEETNSGEPADPIDFGELKKFQFSIRHLLIVTALLSVVMTVKQLTGGCTTVAIAIGVSVAAGWWFVLRQERRQRAQKETELAKLKASIAIQRAREDGAAVTEPAAEEIPLHEPAPTPKFDFSFSLKEMLGAFTVAAVMLGLAKWMGTSDAAMLLGLIALSGLVLSAVGFDPPRVVVLCWWLLLVLYLLVSVWAASSDDQAAVPRPTENVSWGYSCLADARNIRTLASSTSNGNPPLVYNAACSVAAASNAFRSGHPYSCHHWAASVLDQGGSLGTC